MSIRHTRRAGCVHNATGKILVARVSHANHGGSEMTKKPTNDAMYSTLEWYYGPNKTLGDHLRRYYGNYAGEDSASKQYSLIAKDLIESITKGDYLNTDITKQVDSKNANRYITVTTSGDIRSFVNDSESLILESFPGV